MKTLVLGHGRKYSKSYVRCSSLDVNEWYDSDYICVDINKTVEPDIVFDLTKRTWSFCKEDEFDRIIDTTGILFIRSNISHERLYCHGFEEKILKLLKINGHFYGRQTHWQKLENNEIKLFDYTCSQFKNYLPKNQSESACSTC